MDETQKRVIQAYSIIGLVGFAYISIHTVKSERKLRKQIKEAARADMISMKSAYDIVKDKIDAGEYDGEPFDAVIDDFRFYRMIKNEF